MHDYMLDCNLSFEGLATVGQQGLGARGYLRRDEMMAPPPPETDRLVPGRLELGRDRSRV